MLSALFGNTSVRFHVDAFGGSAGGLYEVDGKGKNVELTLDAIDLAQIPMVADVIGLPAEGKIAGTISIALPESKASKGTGAIALDLSDVAVGDGKAKLKGQLPLPRLVVGDVKIAAEAKDGQIKISKLAASGKDLELQGDGRIQMRELATESLLDVNVRFKINDSYRGKNDTTKVLFGTPGGKDTPLFEIGYPPAKTAKRSDGFYRVVTPRSARQAGRRSRRRHLESSRARDHVAHVRKAERRVDPRRRREAWTMKYLVGVIHLPPLPGSPRSTLRASEIARSAAEDASVLAEAGFDLAMIENFGDTPFFVGANCRDVTVSAMTACAMAARDAVPSMPLGINVLRNDADAALAIAAVVGAACIRVNVHTSARVTDQGVVQGDAATTLRRRRELSADGVAIWADVDVKHSAPLAARPIHEEAQDLVHRALADALLVTGSGTGRSVDVAKLEAVRNAVPAVPVLVASGAVLDSLEVLARFADGVVVGSALRANGIAGGRVDRPRAIEFAERFRGAFGR